MKWTRLWGPATKEAGTRSSLDQPDLVLSSMDILEPQLTPLNTWTTSCDHPIDSHHSRVLRLRF